MVPRAAQVLRHRDGGAGGQAGIGVVVVEAKLVRAERGRQVHGPRLRGHAGTDVDVGHGSTEVGEGAARGVGGADGSEDEIVVGVAGTVGQRHGHGVPRQGLRAAHGQRGTGDGEGLRAGNPSAGCRGEDSDAERASRGDVAGENGGRQLRGAHIGGGPGYAVDPNDGVAGEIGAGGGQREGAAAGGDGVRADAGKGGCRRWGGDSEGHGIGHAAGAETGRGIADSDGDGVDGGDVGRRDGDGDLGRRDKGEGPGGATHGGGGAGDEASARHGQGEVRAAGGHAGRSEAGDGRSGTEIGDGEGRAAGQTGIGVVVVEAKLVLPQGGRQVHGPRLGGHAGTDVDVGHGSTEVGEGAARGVGGADGSEDEIVVGVAGTVGERHGHGVPRQGLGDADGEGGAGDGEGLRARHAAARGGGENGDAERAPGGDVAGENGGGQLSGAHIGGGPGGAVDPDDGVAGKIGAGGGQREGATASGDGARADARERGRGGRGGDVKHEGVRGAAGAEAGGGVGDDHGDGADGGDVGGRDGDGDLGRRDKGQGPGG